MQSMSMCVESDKNKTTSKQIEQRVYYGAIGGFVVGSSIGIYTSYQHFKISQNWKKTDNGLTMSLQSTAFVATCGILSAIGGWCGGFLYPFSLVAVPATLVICVCNQQHSR
jgi:hypothetical protein